MGGNQPVSMAFDRLGKLWLAFSGPEQHGDIGIAAWEASGWVPVDSPGVGNFASLAIDPENRVGVAWNVAGSQPSVAVAVRDDNAWQRQPTLSVGGTLPVANWGYPALTFTASNQPAVAWGFEGSPDSTCIFLLDGSAWVVLPAPNGDPCFSGDDQRPGLSSVPGTNTLQLASVPGGALASYALWTGVTWEYAGGTSLVNTSGLAGDFWPVPAMGSEGPFVAWNATGTASINLRQWTGTEWAGLGGSETQTGLGPAYYDIAPAVATTPAGMPMVAWSGGGAAVFLRYWSGTAWEGLDGSASPGIPVAGVSGAHVALTRFGDRTCVAFLYADSFTAANAGVTVRCIDTDW